MRLLRWLLSVPLALLGYVVAVAAAITLTSLLEQLCPPELLVSGMCTATWYPTVELVAMALSTALGAALFVVLPVLVVPSHRLRVAVVALLVGAAYSVWFLAQVDHGFLAPVCSAIGSGALTTWLLASRFKNVT